MNFKTPGAGHAIAIAISLFTMTVHAETWQLGLLGENSRSPFLNGQAETNALPMINYIGERFSYVAGKAQYGLSSNERADTYIIGQIRQRQFYSASLDLDDDLDIEGMGERDPALELGLGTSKQIAWGKFEIEGLVDVTSAHEGFEITAKYSYPKQSGRWMIEPSVALQLQNADLVDYYHGVTDSESQADRPAYRGHQAINTLVSLAVGYSINPKILAILGVEQLTLDQGITDSPIVEDHQLRKVYLGMIYSF